jgi:hypothetical protein
MHPVITIFCAFTRYWAVDQWLDNLSKMRHDPALTNIAIIIDLDDPRILRAVRAYVERNNYRKFVFAMNEEWQPNETRLKVRRSRIADVKNQSKELINQCDGDYVISLEDDTVYPNLDLMRLIQPLIDDPTFGFVEGVQCGRWGIKMIGAWSADSPQDPMHIETMLPPKVGDDRGHDGYEVITGGGWYGYATLKSLYVNCEYYSSSTEPWGPDVNYGFWLGRLGYKSLIDWSTVFGHNDYNKVLYPDENLAIASFNKDRKTGRWTRQDQQGGDI